MSVARMHHAFQCALKRYDRCPDNWLIVRVGEERAAQSLGQPGIKLLDIGGKPMKGWLMADESIWQTEEGLQRWIQEAKKFVVTLPSAEK